MLVEVGQQLLHIGLQHISAGLAAREVSPILSGIKVNAGMSGLSLTTCNVSVKLQYLIPCDCEHLKIHKEGSTVIPARYLMDIIRSFPSGSIVNLKEIKSQFIQIESGNSIYRLATMDASQFPDMLPMDSISGFSISNKEFKRMVKQVTFAAATHESKLLFTGISCQTNNGELKLTATDGIRLAARSMKLASDSSSPVPSVVIPAKHLSDYSKMLSDSSFATQITIADHIICFQSLNFSMQSLLIQGTFPSIDRLVPKHFSTEITMDTAPFLHAIQRVSLIAGKQHVVGLRILSTEIVLFASATEVGDVSETLQIQENLGESLTVFFNGNFMKDIMLAIDCTQVYLRLTGKNKPIIIQPTNNPEALYIITPVMTANQQ